MFVLKFMEYVFARFKMMLNVNAKITILKWEHIDNGNKTKEKHHKIMANKQMKQTKKKKKRRRRGK